MEIIITNRYMACKCNDGKEIEFLTHDYILDKSSYVPYS